MLIGQQCVDFDSDNRQQNEFELLTENNKHPMNGGGRGGLRILLFSEVTLFEYNVSNILSPIVVLEQTNLLGFILGGKSFHKYFKDCEIIFWRKYGWELWQDCSISGSIYFYNFKCFSLACSQNHVYLGMVWKIPQCAEISHTLKVVYDHLKKFYQ